MLFRSTYTEAGTPDPYILGNTYSVTNYFKAFLLDNVTEKVFYEFYIRATAEGGYTEIKGPFRIYVRPNCLGTISRDAS